MKVLLPTATTPPETHLQNILRETPYSGFVSFMLTLHRFQRVLESFSSRKKFLF